MFLPPIPSSKEVDFAAAIQYSGASAIGVSSDVNSDATSSYLFGYVSGGVYNHIIAKYDRHGSLQWQKNYNSSNYGLRSAFCIDNNENIYVSDVFSFSGLTGKIHTLMKIDQSGTVLWGRNFYANSSDNPLPTATAASSDGAYVYTAGHIGTYGYYVKYNSSGAPLVQRKFTASTTILNSHMCIDSSNNVFLVVGEASKMTLAKFSSDGTLVWQRQITSLIPYDITCDASGNPHIAGYRYDPDPASSNTAALNGEGHVVKYNSSGQLQWQKKINLTPQGSYDTSFFGGIRVGSDGSVYANLLATDYFYYPPSNIMLQLGTTHPALIKFDSNGNYQWSRNYKIQDGTSNRSYGNKISIDKNDDIYIASTIATTYSTSTRLSYGMIKITPKIEVNDVNINLYSNTSIQLNKDGLGYYTYTAANSTQTESAGSLTSSDAAFTHNEATGMQSAFVNYAMTDLFSKKI